MLKYHVNHKAQERHLFVFYIYKYEWKKIAAVSQLPQRVVTLTLKHTLICIGCDSCRKRMTYHTSCSGMQIRSVIALKIFATHIRFILYARLVSNLIEFTPIECRSFCEPFTLKESIMGDHLAMR